MLHRPSSATHYAFRSMRCIRGVDNRYRTCDTTDIRLRERVLKMKSFPKVRFGTLAPWSACILIACTQFAACSSDPDSSPAPSTASSSSGSTGGSGGFGGSNEMSSSSSSSGTGGTGGGIGGMGGSAPKSQYLVSIDHMANPSVLLKIDVATGAGKTVCALPNDVDAINFPSSTFSRSGVLFASNYQDARLDKIDPCTCQVTPVGPTGFGGIPGITVNYGPGLYGIEVTLDILLDINTMTGKGTKLGDLGVDFETGGATWSDTLNNGQGGLYAINGLTNSLYSLNAMTGAATLLAPISGVTFGSVGIEMHPANDVLYACTTDAILYKIDPMTGAATGIGTGMGHVSSCNNLAAPWMPVPCLDAL